MIQVVADTAIATQGAQWDETLVLLLPDVWTAVLGFGSGLGGAALLELWLKGRKRRNVAAVLAAEMGINAQLIAAHFVVRSKAPFKIGEDFRLSVIGFQTLLDIVCELPADLVGRTLLLYSRFDRLNDLVASYSETMNRYEEMGDDDPRRAQTEKTLIIVVDTFNSGADKAFRDVKELHPVLMKIGRIKARQPDPEKPADDFVKRVEYGIVERQQRLVALERLRHRQLAREQAP